MADAAELLCQQTQLLSTVRKRSQEYAVYKFDPADEQVSVVCKEILAAGFQYDAIMGALSRSGSALDTMKITKDIVAAKYKYTRTTGYVWTGSEGPQAVMVYSHYPKEKSGTKYDAAALRSIFKEKGLVKTLKLVTSLLQLGRNMEKFYKEHGPFLYVFMIAAAPEHQRKGLGSQLLRQLTELADEQGLWCYLEASSEGSQRLYRRHGFTDMYTTHLKGTGAFWFIMSRPPSAVGKQVDGTV